MLKKLAFAAAAVALSAPVLADHQYRGHDRGYWRYQHHHRPVVVVPPPRVVYRPAPVYYYDYAPPRVIYTPPPVFYGPPLPASGISIRLSFPL